MKIRVKKHSLFLKKKKKVLCGQNPHAHMHQYYSTTAITIIVIRAAQLYKTLHTKLLKKFCAHTRVCVKVSI